MLQDALERQRQRKNMEGHATSHAILTELEKAIEPLSQIEGKTSREMRDEIIFQ